MKVYGIQPLARARIMAHDAFDRLWKSGRMKRGEAYLWLSERMGLPQKECHIGSFNVEQCERVIAIMEEAYNAGREEEERYPPGFGA